MGNAKAVVLGLAMAAACVAAMPAGAQVTTAPTIKAKAQHTTQPKPIKGKFEVMHMQPTSIQVRSVTNPAAIQTFTYSDSIRDRIQQILANGGYQYGDDVIIEYWPDKQIAVKITGKPSKPL